MTAHSWPEDQRPTAAQLLEYVRDPQAYDALEVLDRLLTAAEQADRCLISGHDAQAAELNATISYLAGRAHRYRLAWMNARTRTRILRAITAGLFDRIADLEEDPDGNR